MYFVACHHFNPAYQPRYDHVPGGYICSVKAISPGEQLVDLRFGFFCAGFSVFNFAFASNIAALRFMEALKFLLSIKMSLTALAKKLTGKKYSIAGVKFFKYKGEWLNDIRQRLGVLLLNPPHS